MLPFFWPSFQLAQANSYSNNAAAQSRPNRAISSTWPRAQSVGIEVGPSSRQVATTTTATATSAADAWPLLYLSSPMSASNYSPTIVSLDSEAALNSSRSDMNELDSPSSQPGPATTPMSSVSNVVVPASATTAKLKQQINQQQRKKQHRKPNYLLQQATSASPYLDSTRLASRYPMPKIKFQLRETTPMPAHTTAGADLLMKQSAEREQQQQQQHLFKTNQQAANSDRPRHAMSLKSQLAEGKVQHIQVPKSLSKLIAHQLLTNATSLLAHHKNHSSQNGTLAGLRMAPTTSISKVVRLKNDTDLQIMLQVSSSGLEQDLKRTPQPAELSTIKKAAQAVSASRLTTTTTTTTTASPTILTNTQTDGWRPKKVIPDNKSVQSGPTTVAPPSTTPTPAPTTTFSIQTTTKTSTLPPAESQHVEQESGQRAASRRQVRAEAMSRQDKQPLLSVAQLQKPSQQVDEMIGSNKVLPEEESLHQVGSISTTTSRPSGSTPRKFGSKSMVEKEKESNEATSNKWRHAKGEQVAFHSSQRNSNFNNNNGNQNISNKNIKLFHFKRKPDMAKLPFYKKPLNYTELGWTPEQIQDHLEQSAALLASVGVNSAEQSNNNYNQAQAANGTTEETSRAELLLLKRKRRGKSQFERLMAELHGGQSQPVTLPAAGPLPVEDQAADNDNEDDSVATEQSTQARTLGMSVSQPLVAPSLKRQDEQRVPVMKKKVEALVLKPVFFVMNQKRRPSANTNSSSQYQTPTTTLAPVAETANTTPVVGELIENSLGKSDYQNKSKPIIRLRRKHHGDQPMSQFRHPSELWQSNNQQAPWQPSRPFWSMASHNSMGNKLLLVPSGLLTPSGSHLVPLYEPQAQTRGDRLSADEQSRLVNDLFAWRPSRAQANEAWQADSHAPSLPVHPKPSGGLAPNGEESFLVAPSVPTVSTDGDRLVLLASSMEKQHAAQQQQHQQTPSGVTQQAASKEPEPGLRVPKLLVRPLTRPAKYSLNGYIPRPSLTAGAHQQQPLQAQNQPMTGNNKPKLRSSFSSSSSSSLSGLQTQNKDLDSSTSNEIFSRRRGLQQHQRSAQAKQQLAFNSLLSANNHTNQNNNNNNNKPAIVLAGQRLPFPANQSGHSNMSAQQRQMEENKRKYIVQQQQLMTTPTISIHKVNLIKAKLGLSVKTKANSNSLQSSSTFNNQQHKNALASTNNIITADPTSSLTDSDGTDKSNLNSIVTNSSGQLIGAPLNSIPKTDFECTDKKGKFVAGLFADFKTGCQVWHLCSNNRKYSFLCPTGTIFNSKLRICDWRYNVKCENSIPFI